MEAEDPLGQLRDIHLPGPVAFWPPAPGWWLLLVVILIGLAYFYRHAIARMIQRRKLASTLKELDQALGTYKELALFDTKKNQAGLDYLAEINILLKRVAQVIFPLAGAGFLTGSAWLKFLDQKGNTREFSNGIGSTLADGIYRRSYEGDADALHKLAKTWIESCYTQQKIKPSPLQFPLLFSKESRQGRAVN